MHVDPGVDARLGRGEKVSHLGLHGYRLQALRAQQLLLGHPRDSPIGGPLTSTPPELPVRLDHADLREYGFELSDAQLAAVRRMDKADNLDLLEAIGDGITRFLADREHLEFITVDQLLSRLEAEGVESTH